METGKVLNNTTGDQAIFKLIMNEDPEGVTFNVYHGSECYSADMNENKQLA